jgi:RloB-like protein
MSRHENAQRRHSPVRARLTILVWCGAIRTEPDYFNGLRRRFRNSGVTIKVRSVGAAPDVLVRAAASYRDSKGPGAFDQVWCVVDTDEFDIDAAVTEARRNGVRLAISNPCFELWLLLHHADCRSFCAGCAEVVRRLRKYLPNYDKAQVAFSDFADGVLDAVKRARGLEPTGEEHRHNPSTNVWRLVEQIVGKA